MAAIDLVLASNSPRRRELLALGSWSFTVRPADVDESALPGEIPGAYVSRLAAEKAAAGAAASSPTQVILAADTTVTVDGAILGKPANAAKAVAMLRQLRGRDHAVLTAIALCMGDSLVTDLCRTTVPMRAYTQTEIDAYVASGDPLDKAGAYAIQHAGFHPVENFSGCFASVMGLPLCHLMRSLQKLAIAPPAQLPSRCQAFLHYSCPVSAAILRGETAG